MCPETRLIQLYKKRVAYRSEELWIVHTRYNLSWRIGPPDLVFVILSVVVVWTFMP